MNSSLKICFTLDQPSICEGHRTVVAAEAHRSWVVFFLPISDHPIHFIIIAFGIEGVDKLSDYVGKFFRSLVQFSDFLAVLLTKSFFNWPDSSQQIGDLLHIRLFKPFAEGFKGLSFIVIR